MASALGPAQRRTLKTILRVAQEVHATPREIKAAIETGITETGLTNPGHGDGSSVGWRQETASSYPSVNRLDVAGSARRFFAETRANRGVRGSAGTLAQSVQRSAFPGRYDTHSAKAEALMHRYLGSYVPDGGVDLPGQKTVELGTKTTFDQAGYEQAQKRTLLAGFLAKHKSPDSILFKSGLLSTAAPDPAEFTSSALTSKIVDLKPKRGAGGISTTPGTTPDTVRQLIEKANTIDAEHLPYKWGGGHGPTPAKPGIPVDCSGAVSRLLGVNPRVSGQFASWGQAGRGKSVTIYANDHHVLMEINGHFWGTSGTNPGGGAGWIPRSAISPQYLKNFTARHPAGL